MALKLVFVTCPSIEKAREIASVVVTEKLAACVNILAAVESLYFWEGALQRDTETLLIIKSVQEKLEALKQRVFELHPYQTPEFVAISSSEVSEKYERWVKDYLVGAAPG